MASLAEIRAKAREHARQLEAVRHHTVQDLAARWGVSDETVRNIPRKKLPYLAFGKNGMRRYHPDDVAAYEAAEKSEDAA